VKGEALLPLEPSLYRETVRRALAEDIRSGDVTTVATVPPDLQAVGEVVCGAPCVLAGLEVAVETFSQLDPTIHVSRSRRDGDQCGAGDEVLRVAGLGRALLAAERTALNFLQRMSGVATLTHRCVAMVKGRTIVLDTRKTIPTLRALDKYAVRAGGGVNHRMALDDAILIKDNHIALVGSISEAVSRVKRAGHTGLVTVEVQNRSDVAQAIESGADVLLADNMDRVEIEETIRLTRGVAKVEVSGGLTVDRLEEIAVVGPEYVSIGAMTHSAPAVDFSFDLNVDTSLK
jgi:nicotinate-nucleotide pyrophosphorylase (carboxylating)